jgi:hypothetical protein
MTFLFGTILLLRILLEGTISFLVNVPFCKQTVCPKCVTGGEDKEARPHPAV